MICKTCHIKIHRHGVGNPKGVPISGRIMKYNETPRKGLMPPRVALTTVLSIHDAMKDPLVKRLVSLADIKSSSGRILRYIDQYEAFTYDILEHICGVTRESAVKTTRILRVNGVVFPVGKISYKSTGRPAKIFIKAESSPSRIDEAEKIHLDINSLRFEPINLS